ncbi:MAG: hypothetical protein ACYCY2_16285 [Acidithiobacillus ferriphilus]|uniref:hypothetical protein n=1 Tax=Acidithiobacillus ferriphilus TaxID=1689834 RepID=UPI001C067202|nr:hypothetical protein [Acidithiobacillus ferriphilus]MBU2828438.1 hypothetical protein [Acidithiobacillus ferriphilus]
MSLEQIFLNQYFIAYIGGPISAAFFSWLFGGKGFSSQQPQNIWINIQKTVNNNPSLQNPRRAQNDVDASFILTLLITLAIVIAILSFTIAFYLKPITNLIGFSNIFITTFTITGVLINSIISRKIHWEFLFMAIISIAFIYLTNSTYTKIIPYSQYATQIATDNTFDISSIVSTITSFYRGMDGEQLAYFFLLIASYVLVMLGTIATLLRFIYFSAITSLRFQQSISIIKLINFTHRFSGKGYFLLIILMIGFSYATYHGYTYIYGFQLLGAIERFSR